MKNKIKSTVYGALLVGSFAGGFFCTNDVIGHAQDNNILAYETVANASFKDVATDYYAYEAILWAKENGIVNGYPDGTFKPNGIITEAHFAKMIANFLGLKDDKGNLTKYTPSATEYDTYYDALAAYSVPLNGYFDDGLRSKPVKRGVIAQAIGHMTGNANSLLDSINFMLIEGLTTGQNPQYETTDVNKFFGSENNLTRAQVAAFLYRMHKGDLDEVTGIALVANKNNEGLSLVGLANKGVNKLDSSLRVGRFGSEKQSTGGSFEFTPGTPSAEVSKPDYSNAKLPVSSNAKSRNINVEELNKTVDRLSSKTINGLKNGGYTVSLADVGGSVFFAENNLSFTLLNSSDRAYIVYSNKVNTDLLLSIIKDATGYTVDKSKLYPSYENSIKTKDCEFLISSNGDGTYMIYFYN